MIRIDPFTGHTEFMGSVPLTAAPMIPANAAAAPAVRATSLPPIVSPAAPAAYGMTKTGLPAAASPRAVLQGFLGGQAIGLVR